ADGSLEQQMLMPLPLSMVVLVRLFTHWLMTGFPIVIVSPVIGFQFGLTLYETGVMALTLLLGTPVLVLLGAIAAALTVGLRSSGALITLLLLPLYVPILILASTALTAAMAGQDISAHLYLLGAALALAIPVAPYAVVVALKITLD
ncbi:MAG: heme exporter protein CcmB, partial [Hydrogenovibrio sp.]|uniref:heme exporter protein CcmB n=1 Tax=Hydrogenovibrio sp. TaxID=2065821 RepID=UPI00286FFE5D